MDLFVGSLLNGVAYGTLYGLLGFAIVLLYKSTGIANFGQGNLGTLAVFVVFAFAVRQEMNLWVAVVLGFLGAAAAGALSYLLVIRPRDTADHLNTTMRTLGLYLLLFAVVNYEFAVGQPFNFPTIFPDSRAFTIGGNGVTWTTIGTLSVALLLSASFAWFFRRTSLGLLFLGMASRPEIAELMGVRIRRLTLFAWTAAACVSLVVALSIAPVALLTSDMMDPFLLLAFTAAILGGLTSMVGVFLGGLVIGVLDNMVTVYSNSDSAMLSVFALLIVVLLVKPEGLLGTKSTERL